MRVITRSIALLAGLLLAVACESARAPGQPSFDTVAASHHGDRWDTDPCGPHHPMVAVCRMLRPVRG